MRKVHEAVSAAGFIVKVYRDPAADNFLLKTFNAEGKHTPDSDEVIVNKKEAFSRADTLVEVIAGEVVVVSTTPAPVKARVDVLFPAGVKGTKVSRRSREGRYFIKIDGKIERANFPMNVSQWEQHDRLLARQAKQLSQKQAS